jgi:hypothetical protein
MHRKMPKKRILQRRHSQNKTFTRGHSDADVEMALYRGNPRSYLFLRYVREFKGVASIGLGLFFKVPEKTVQFLGDMWETIKNIA